MTLRRFIFISFQQITFKLGDFINLKALSWVVSTDFPELVNVKSWKKSVKRSMQQHTVLCPTDSLPTHPDSLQIELIHLLYTTCWGEDLSCELPLLKTFFHVMSNVESLDNQTFLFYLVDSFINVFQLQDFHLFLYFCFIHPSPQTPTQPITTFLSQA